MMLKMRAAIGDVRPLVVAITGRAPDVGRYVTGNTGDGIDEAEGRGGCTTPYADEDAGGMGTLDGAGTLLSFRLAPVYGLVREGDGLEP